MLFAFLGKYCLCLQWILIPVILVCDLKSSFNLAKIKVKVINLTYFYFEIFLYTNPLNNYLRIENWQLMTLIQFLCIPH